MIETIDAGRHAPRTGRWTRALRAAALGAAVFGCVVFAGALIGARMCRDAIGGEDLFSRSERRLRAAETAGGGVDRGATKPTTILLFGDTGCASPEFRRNLAAMAGERADLAIHAGDVSYHGPTEYGLFVRAVDHLPFPVFATPGDHDRDADVTLAEYDRAIGGRDRSLDWRDLRVVFVDSSSESLARETIDFLERELGRAPRPRFSIVVTHCPPCEPHREYPADIGHGHALKGTASVERFMSVLERFSVSLLVTGHVHAFSDVKMGATRVIVTGGGGRGVEPGEAFHFARVTLAEPDVTLVEEVVTSPGHDNEALRHVADSATAFVLAHGRETGAVSLAFAAAALLLSLLGRSGAGPTGAALVRE